MEAAAFLLVAFCIPGTQTLRAEESAADSARPSDVTAEAMVPSTMEASSKDAELATNSPEPNEDGVLERIHEMNLLQIRAGLLAAKRGQSVLVRRMGNRLERDHRKSEAMVEGLARSFHVTLGPTSLPGATAEAARLAAADSLMRRLQSLNGADFDSAYLLAVVESHEKAITLLRSVQASEPDTPVGDLISKLLPILEQHRRLAEDVGQRIGQPV